MDEIEILYKKAHEAKQSGNIPLLRKYYEDINKINPDTWEAKFCLAYYKAMDAKEKYFWSESIEVMNTGREIFETLKKGIGIKEEQVAIESICKGVHEISEKFIHDTKHNFAKNDSETRNDHITEYVGTLSVTAEMLYSCGDDIVSSFGNKYYSYAVAAWKEAISINSSYVKYVLNKNEQFKTINKYSEKILIFDKDYKKPSYEASSGSKSSLTSKIKNLIKKFK